MALSSIVIGLPIAIIIVLINLPKLSTRRDTRQQHYILLAFGFPFSLVVIVALVYGVYSLIRRIRQGPDHSKHFRSRMSWRRFSRRLRGFSQRDHHHHRHHHRCSVDNKQCNHHSSCSSLNSSELALGTEPKLYSLVAQVMSAKQRDIESEPHLIFQTSDPLPESNTTVQLSAACLQHHGWRSSPAPIWVGSKQEHTFPSAAQSLIECMSITFNSNLQSNYVHWKRGYVSTLNYVYLICLDFFSRIVLISALSLFLEWQTQTCQTHFNYVPKMVIKAPLALSGTKTISPTTTTSLSDQQLPNP